MNKSAIIGTVFGVALATAGAGYAGYSLMDRNENPSVAQTQNCFETQVEQPFDPKDDRRIAGSVIGGLIGGAVGKDLGDSDITTVAGAAVGAIAGNQAQKKLQDQRSSTTTEIRCEPAQ